MTGILQVFYLVEGYQLEGDQTRDIGVQWSWPQQKYTIRLLFLRNAETENFNENAK